MKIITNRSHDPLETFSSNNVAAFPLNVVRVNYAIATRAKAVNENS